MPLLLVSYIVAYLDRVNIGYAQLQMKDALGFSSAAFVRCRKLLDVHGDPLRSKVTNVNGKPSVAEACASRAVSRQPSSRVGA